MANAHKQSWDGPNVGSGTGLTVSKAVTPNRVGNALIAVGISGQASGSNLTISDTASNTWNTLLGPTSLSGNGTVKAWWAAANGTSSTTISIKESANNGGFLSQLGDEFDCGGTFSSSNIDQSRALTNVVSVTSSGNLTGSGDAVWLASSDSITAVGNIAGSAATKGADDTASDWTEFRIISGGSGATVTGAFTGTASGAITFLAAFKATAAAGPSNLLMMMGCGS